MSSSRCGECSGEVVDGAKCSLCHNQFHITFECSGITELGFHWLGEQKATWRCSQCTQGALLVEDTVNGRTTATLDADISTPATDNQQEIENPSNNYDDEYDALKSDLIDITAKILNDDSKVIKQFTDKVNCFEKRMLVLERKMIDNEVKLLQLEEQANKNEQWARSNNIEIKGVPEVANENLFNIVLAIGKRIVYPIRYDQLSFANRIRSGTSNTGRVIIACFISRCLKEGFVAAARVASKSSPIYPINIGLQGFNQIYVNDHFTVQNKMLLARAKQEAEDRGYQFKWTKNCKIMVRKNRSSPTIHINTARDLDKIK